MSIHGCEKWESVPLSLSLCLSLSFYQSACLPLLSLSPSVALSQQLESVSGKTLLVVHALWDKVATTSVTIDSGAVGRRHGSHNSTSCHTHTHTHAVGVFFSCTSSSSVFSRLL